MAGIRKPHASGLPELPGPPRRARKVRKTRPLTGVVKIVIVQKLYQLQRAMADEQKQEESKVKEGEEKKQTQAEKPAERFSTEPIKPGATVRVSQKIVEGDKERIQVFEGIVLGRRGSRGANETITVRKLSQGFGVERIFPLALPTITNIEVVKQARVHRAKLGYLRDSRAKKLKDA